MKQVRYSLSRNYYKIDDNPYIMSPTLMLLRIRKLQTSSAPITYQPCPHGTSPFEEASVDTELHFIAVLVEESLGWPLTGPGNGRCDDILRSLILLQKRKKQNSEDNIGSSLFEKWL